MVKSKSVNIVDGYPTGEAAATVDENNNKKKFNVIDAKTNNLLTNILLELKKINLHLSLINDENIENKDI